MSSRRFKSQKVDSMRSKVYFYRGHLYDNLSTAKGQRTRDINWFKNVAGQSLEPFKIYEGTVTYEEVELNDN